MTRWPGLRRSFGSIARPTWSATSTTSCSSTSTVRREIWSRAAWTPDDARREADRRFGDVERTRERLVAIDRQRVASERRADWWGGLPAGSPLRAARAAPETGLHGRGRAHARPRHRRQRDDVRHRRPAAVPAAGLPGPRQPGAPRVAGAAWRPGPGHRRGYPYRRYLDLAATTKASTSWPHTCPSVAVGIGDEVHEGTSSR